MIQCGVFALATEALHLPPLLRFFLFYSENAARYLESADTHSTESCNTQSMRICDAILSNNLIQIMLMPVS
jgi:hypothetical protein